MITQPANRSLRALLPMGAVLLVSAATGLYSSQDGAATVSVTPRGPVASPLAPLHLRVGAYAYVIQDIGPEVTAKDGSAPEPAELAEETQWSFTLDASGAWTEQSQTGPRIERAFDGQRHSQSVDGTPQDVPNTPTADEAAARTAGSSLPLGGPHLELNPYGASFVLHMMRASATASQALGLEASETNEAFACGSRMCTRTTITRQVPRPEDESEYLSSLPWDGDNIERTELLYEPDTQIIHLHHITFDDVTLHRFELQSSP